LGTGEGLDALEAFDAGRIAGRILGQGDMLGLIRRAEESFAAGETQKQAQQLLSGDFNMQDMLDQFRQIRKLGSLGQILDMLPGAAAGKLTPEAQRDAEREMKRKEAILCSMTPGERREPEILDASRELRSRRSTASSSSTARRGK
jgi:signal recognition particle subunit SRP54